MDRSPLQGSAPLTHSAAAPQQRAWPTEPAHPGRPAERSTERQPEPRRVDASLELGDTVLRTYLRFVVSDAGRVQVSVVNADTNELIRQIPADEVLRTRQALRDYAERGSRHVDPALMDQPEVRP